MKKLVLIIIGGFISAVAIAQAPRNDQNPNTPTNPGTPNMPSPQNNPYQRTADPTILNPAPTNHHQRVDTPAYRLHNDSVRNGDSLNYNYRRHRTDTLPRDDRDPNKIRMNRDSIK